MAAFAAGGADVLVATTVIEVGIDVPNASVMLVEDAERYGISQLHQLRGRIGRGPHESVCVLFGPKESPRLRALAEHRDGFKLAEIDLELRGEGEMIGTRQSGLAQFRVARLPEDAELLDARARSGRRCWRPTRSWRCRSTRCSTGPSATRTGPTRSIRSRRDPVRVIAGRYGGRRLQAPAGAAPRARPPTACARRCSRSWARGYRALVCSTCSPARARSGSRRSRAAPRPPRSSTPRRRRCGRCGPTSRRSGRTARSCGRTPLRWLRCRIRRGASIRSRLPRSAHTGGQRRWRRAVGGAARSAGAGRAGGLGVRPPRAARADDADHRRTPLRRHPHPLPWPLTRQAAHRRLPRLLRPDHDRARRRDHARRRRSSTS